MITAKTLIEDAFDDLEIKPIETELTDNEYAVGIRRLNRLGVVFAAAGLNFGYTKIQNVTDTLTIPDWAEDLFITFLAIRLAPSFGAEAAKELIVTAASLMNTAQQQLIQLPAVTYPTTLPLGGGNRKNNSTTYFKDGALYDLTTDSLAFLTDDESVSIADE